MQRHQLLTRQQAETIHRNALRVLAEVGVAVEHGYLRTRLSSVGGHEDDATQRVRFSPKQVQRQIDEAPKRCMENGPPRVGEHSGIYQSSYLDPVTEEILPFDENRLALYAALGRNIHGGTLNMIGVPFVLEGIPPAQLPLAEKLYGWKYGLDVRSVQRTALCEPLLEMYRCHSSASGRSLEEAFAAQGFLISPLKLARPECEQLLFFHERGLRMNIGHLPMQGATAPVTLAGALVLSLAEQIFLFLLTSALWGSTEFFVGGGVSTVDMRSGNSCYGRPEMQRINVAWGDLARYYGCGCGGHTGMTDAKIPSTQAGAQKAVGTLITALATGHASLEAGLLSMDEICSPVQMVLDHDIANSLRALLAEVIVDETECAFEDILSAIGDGGFLGSDLTAAKFRSALFVPQTWDSQPLRAWQASGAQQVTDRALEIFEQFRRNFEPYTCISIEEEKELRGILCKAAVTCSPAD